MAVSSNRSPSPLTSRPNPHPRTFSSEAHSAVRRSFSGSPSPKPFPLTNPRRSFSPITPANSPADSGRRVLPVKEEIATSWDCAEKENEKATKLPSPAKGSKNFMSPTISAASKFSPSPKKKVLVERNEPVRTSITLCDDKATFFSSISSDSTDYSKPKSEIRLDKSKVPGITDPKEAVLRGPPVTKTSRRVTFAEVPLDCDNSSDSLSETVVIDSDIETCPKNINSRSTLSPSTTLAPLDADPSLTPYDPKTNYLSRRPQFLHYRPNPRIEVLRSMDKGIEMRKPKQLDDSFMSEIVSENSDSESQIEDSHKESEDSSSTEVEIIVEPVVKEAEVVEEPKSPEQEIVPKLETEETEMVEEPKSEEEMVLEPETEETEVLEELDSELSLPVSTPTADEMAKEIPDGQKRTKPGFFISPKLASTILLLMIVCVSISVTDFPILNSYRVKDLKLTDLSYLGSQIPVLIQSTLDGHFKRLSDSSSLITDELVGPMQFTNLTDLKGGSKWELEQEREFKKLEEKLEDELDNDVESEKLVKKVEEGEVEEGVDSDLEASEGEDDSGFSDSQGLEFGEKLEFEDEVEGDSAEAEASKGEVYTDFSDNSEMESEGNLVLEVEGGQATTQVTVNDGDTSGGNPKQELIDSCYDSVDVDCLVAASQAFDIQFEARPTDVQPDVVEVVKFQGDDNRNSHTELVSTLLDANLESKIDDSCVEKPSSSVMLESPVQIQERSFTMHYMLGISSFFLGVVAVAVSIFLKQKNVTPDYVVPADPCLPKSLLSASAKHKGQEKQSSENWPTEVNVVAVSCPSEMSSFEVSTSYRNVMQTSRAQRQDRKLGTSSTRRESVAVSSDYSLGSPSYGSFTTYERIPIKHGSGDEEVMTPVRRSSRIRSQVTSP